MLLRQALTRRVDRAFESSPSCHGAECDITQALRQVGFDGRNLLLDRILELGHRVGDLLFGGPAVFAEQITLFNGDQFAAAR